MAMIPYQITYSQNHGGSATPGNISIPGGKVFICTWSYHQSLQPNVGGLIGLYAGRLFTGNISDSLMVIGNAGGTGVSLGGWVLLSGWLKDI